MSGIQQAQMNRSQHHHELSAISSWPSVVRDDIVRQISCALGAARLVEDPATKKDLLSRLPSKAMENTVSSVKGFMPL